MGFTCLWASGVVAVTNTSVLIVLAIIGWSTEKVATWRTLKDGHRKEAGKARISLAV